MLGSLSLTNHLLMFKFFIHFFKKQTILTKLNTCRSGYPNIMPIVIKDYKWKQTADNISVIVSLKGTSENNVDVFTSKRYIKVNFEQYFFEAILLHPIDVSKSQCKLTDSNVTFELQKKESIEWGSLEPDIPRKEKQQLKQQLLEEEYSHTQDIEKDKANKKAELKRVAVREQIELDTKQREQIENIKKLEKANALGDVSQWSTSVSILPKKKNNIGTKNKLNLNSQNPPIEVENVPLPRSIKTLEIDFTPREFPTPSRESKLEEENEWLRQQAEARRSAGFISEDIRPEERNPQFLKAKGDEFLRNQNYLGAISAYSYGIKISPKFVDLYIARSEAHLLVGNFNKTIQDCSTALDLLKPAVSLNLKERALCIGRRGEGLCKMGFTKQGIEEIKISLALMPNDYFQGVLETISSDTD